MNSHERYLILIGRSSSYVVISMLLLCLAAPSLPNTVLHYSMEEELPLNTEVGNLPQDANLSVVSPVSPSLLQYSLLGDTSTDPTLHYLAVNQTTGLLYIIKLLDREEVCEPVPECQLVFGVAAFIGQFIHMITVHLDIGDLNDNIPTFSKDHISLSINENTPIGMKYTLPAAKDRDSGSFGVQRYDLDSTFGVFSLDQTQQLKLEITGNLDRETANHYELHLLAYDGGFPPNAGLLTINITIADLNDNVPLFNVSSLEITLPENTTAPSWIAGIHATDDDSGQNGVVRYSLAQDATDTVGKLFRIDPGSGEIYLIGTLDFETAKSYHFEIQAFDHGATSHVSFVTVTVMVEDVNDNSPKIKISSLSSDNLPVVLENSNAGVFVAHVTVSDDDSGDNGDTLCEVNSDFFQLEPLWRSQYQVLTAITFDREEEPFYAITIVCQDSGNPVMRSEKTFNIHIGDENDNVPTFSEQFYSAIIQENNAAGDVLLTFTASDADEGDNGRIEYSILGGASSVFFVDETTSHLKASIGLDFELASVYQFQVEVKDNGVPSLSSTATVEITVIDLNDELPKFLHDSYPLTVLENQPGGQLTGQVSAIDPDGVSAQDIRYFFWIDDTFQTSSIGAFILHSTTGEIKTLASLDREIQDHYDLTVSCYNMDNITMSSTAQVTILVIDENDNAPVFLYPSRENNTIVLSGDIMQGSPIVHLKALDADSGANGELSYSLLENSNDLFSVETQSGELRMSDPQSDGGFDVHQLKISVSDNGMPKHNATALFYVVMNGTLSYIWTEEPDANVKDDNGDGGLGLSGSSLVTFVCIVSVAGVVTTILLAAIVLVLWRGRKKRQLSEYGHQPGFMIGECRAGGVTTSSNLSNNLNASFQSEEDLKIEGLRLHGRLTTTPKGPYPRPFMCTKRWLAQ